MIDKKNNTDISDNEIRIIRSYAKSSGPIQKRTSNWKFWAAIAVGFLALCIVSCFVVFAITYHNREVYNESLNIESRISIEDIDSTQHAFVTCIDTTIQGNHLQILYPNNAMPSLELGQEVLNDSSVVLAAQAADVRKDNQEIVGAFVLKGDLVSRGKSKKGFCAILGNEIILGVAANTPLFEEATQTDGYFFRQFPLVGEGEVIENKSSHRALRKALAQLNDNVCVILAKEPLSLHDFAERLKTLGVKTAIYLTGGKSYGFFKDEGGNKNEFGQPSDNPHIFVNYIVWR